jgi:hypothetical protein
MTERATRRGLVLGGGGVLGAARSVGALTAIEYLNGIDLRDREVIVGTSAGSVLVGLLGPGSGRLVAQSLVSGRHMPPTAVLAGVLPLGRGSLTRVGHRIDAVTPMGANNMDSARRRRVLETSLATSIAALCDPDHGGPDYMAHVG